MLKYFFMCVFLLCMFGCMNDTDKDYYSTVVQQEQEFSCLQGYSEEPQCGLKRCEEYFIDLYWVLNDGGELSCNKDKVLESDVVQVTNAQSPYRVRVVKRGVYEFTLIPMAGVPMVCEVNVK